MKKLLFIFWLIFQTLWVQGQTALWQGTGLVFNSPPLTMYYDTATEASYITGLFNQVNGTPCNVVRLTDTGFTLLPVCPVDHINDIIRHDGKLFFGGNAGLATWDGNAWTSVLGEGYILSSFLPYNNALLIAGRFPVQSTYRYSIYSLENGVFTPDFLDIEQLFGTQNGDIRKMAFYKDKFYIAGNFSNLNADNSIIEIANHDATGWHSPGHLINNGGLSLIRDMLIWKDTLYVCGHFDEASGDGANTIAQWDGNSWHRMGQGLSQSSTPATVDMLVYHDALYASGGFNMVDGRTVGGIAGSGFAKWTGTQWCTMGSEGDGTIQSMGTFKDDLYVMGGFWSINGNNLPNMAKWTGGNYTDSCTLLQGPVSVNELQRKDFTFELFPNPSHGEFVIQFSSAFPNQKCLKIFDVTGNVVYENNLGTRQIEKITLADAGVYFIKVICNNAVVSKRVVVIR